MLSSKYPPTTLRSTPNPNPRPQTNLWTKHTGLVLLAIISFFSWHASSIFSRAVKNAQLAESQQHGAWHWPDITPSRELKWHDCGDGFECGRVDLPLDWLDPSDDSRVAIAVIRLRATDMDNYMGSIFMNPGGPGGSGIHAVRDYGKALQTVAGTNHDIISFDPRGIGATTPSLHCLSSKQNEMLWSLHDVGTVDAHPGILYDYYARSKAISDSCALSFDVGGASILQFMSTTSVARDMLEILHLTGAEKLKYWGLSYGTVLGGMFAALYPDKIERMVNDGNVDLQEWFSGSHINFLNDTDKVMDSFYHFCHLAGSVNCPFYASTPSHIQSRLDKLLQDLKKHPVIALSDTYPTELPEVITFSSVKRIISTALYSPVLMFEPLAHVLSSLEAGNGAPYLNFLAVYSMREPFSCPQPLYGHQDSAADIPEEVRGSNDASKAIQCSDSGDIDTSVEAMEEYSEALQKQSKAAGAVNVLFRMNCAGWKIKAKWRFLGPFTGNTSYPILFVSNSADNITPLRSARNDAKGFANSVLLVQQESFGHTTLASPSLCTASKIRAYYQKGELPSPDTLCTADMKPFGITMNDTKTLSAEDAELENALLELLKAKRINTM